MQTDSPEDGGNDLHSNNKTTVAVSSHCANCCDPVNPLPCGDDPVIFPSPLSVDGNSSVLPTIPVASDQFSNIQQLLSPSDDSGVSLQNKTALRESLAEGGTAADATSVTVMLDAQLDAATSDICRICHGEGDAAHPLIQPCLCAGSLRFVHHPCLQKWILESSTRSCELCRFQFIMSSQSKPFSKWKTLDLSGVERRRVICSVSFHIVALVCVVWSLWVLLERTAEEVSKKNYGWAFWTKLVVVTVGFTGGVVFMYVQCKMYIRLCRRWRTYNRIIYIQDRRPPGQRFCEGSFGSEQPPTQQQQQVVVLADTTSTMSPPPCKKACNCGSMATSTANTAQSNSVAVYTVL